MPKKRKVFCVKIMSTFGMVLAISAFPALFLYFKNADEAGFGEIIAPLMLLLGLGAICFLLCCAAVREANKAALVAVFFVVALGNFRPIEKVFKLILKNLHYWHVLPMVLILLFLASVLLVRKMPDELADILVKVFGIVAVALIFINLIPAVPDIMKYERENRKNLPVQEQTGDGEVNRDLPNVYLLLFDEYAGFSQIQEYYHYGNEELRDFLTDHRFVIAENSQNEYYSTYVTVTNLVNLDYVVTPSDDLAEIETIRKNGTLFSMMRKLGYAVQAVELGNYMGQDSPTRDNSQTGSKTINRETLADLCLGQTVLYPFCQENTSAIMDGILYLCRYLSLPENIPDVPTFTVFYVCFPHQPFLVDENGNRLPSGAYADWDNDSYYLGQYKYATKLMMEILDNLTQNDPGSVIFLQSDHGARAPGFSPEKFSESATKSILNAVYFQGEPYGNLDKKSAVNTVRLVLSDLYGWELGEVAVPQY